MDVPLALHIYGNVKNIFKNHTEYKTDILDLEFVAHPKNINYLKEYKFNKRIGFEDISVENRKIESIETIKKRINKALDILPKNHIIIDPDCSMRNLPK